MSGVPLRAVATASTGVVAAILLAIYAPANAFLALYGTAVAGMLFIWIVILFTYLRFRKALTADQPRGCRSGCPPSRRGVVRDRRADRDCRDHLLCRRPAVRVVWFLPFLLVMSIVYARKRSPTHA